MNGPSGKNILEEKALGKAQDMFLLQQMYPYIRRYWKILAMAAALMVSVTALDLLIPYITKITIDRYIVPQGADHHEGRDSHDRQITVDLSDPEIRSIVSANADLFKIHEKTAEIAYDNLSKLPGKILIKLRKDDIHGVIIMAGYLLISVLASFLLNFILVVALEYAGQMIMHDLRMKLFTHIQELSVAFFTKNPVGRLVTRITNDTQNMDEMFNSVIVFLVKDLFLVLGITVILFYIDWRLALSVHVLFPLVFYASYRFAGSSRESYRTLRVKAAQINSKFAETIGGIAVIQLFNRERFNFNAFKIINHENYKAGMEQITVFAVFMPFIELMSSVAIGIVIFYGGQRLLHQGITLGAIVAFISYLRLFFRPIRDVAEKYNITLNALSSAERIMQLLNESDKVSEPEEKDRVSAPEKLNELQFDHVTFSYLADEVVLNDVSFSLAAGKTIAIVGPTGAGKTSIINLITRFYDPVAGRVFINGIDIRKISIKDLRSKLALVMQDPFLFSGSIRSNIFNNRKIGSEEVERVLEASFCKSFIDKLPDGIDTALTEGGSSLSSGQRQLISIARALATNPELIIFDEATSYIDSETEEKIQQAVFNVTRGRTAIIIAHRLSTARIADTILVLNHGKIIETGSHAELMEQKGFYYRLNQVQG